MPRTINHIDRVIESFDVLEPMTQGDMVAELFSRLSTPELKRATLRRIDFHARMVGLLPRGPRKRNNGTEPSE